MNRLRIADLFCCAGGAAMGLHRAGFEVEGWDIKPQPNYPFRFHLGDALDADLSGFDSAWASPPCQKFTRARKLRGNTHPDYIPEVRAKLSDLGVPYCIENVPGAPLLNPALLCGSMFGLNIYRHRIFESNFPIPLRLCSHSKPQTKMGRPVREGDIIQVVGHFSNVPYARKAMGIDWMNQQELAQAIPPAYSEFIGRAIRQTLHH